MRNQHVPHDSLEGFRVWSDCRRTECRHDDSGIGNLRGVSAVAAHNAQDAGAFVLRKLQGLNQVRADIFFFVSAAHGKHQHGVVSADAAHFQPIRKDRGPAVVVCARGEFRNVVGGGVGFNTGNLAEVVRRVAGVSSASADTQYE